MATSLHRPQYTDFSTRSGLWVLDSGLLPQYANPGMPPDDLTFHTVLELLASVPWFVISAFAASAVLAVAAGRTSSADTATATGTATRTVGVIYAVAVGVVTGLWILEQVQA